MLHLGAELPSARNRISVYLFVSASRHNLDSTCTRCAGASHTHLVLRTMIVVGVLAVLSRMTLLPRMCVYLMFVVPWLHLILTYVKWYCEP